jgi:hypothetical protein
MTSIVFEIGMSWKAFNSVSHLKNRMRRFCLCAALLIGY